MNRKRFFIMIIIVLLVVFLCEYSIFSIKLNSKHVKDINEVELEMLTSYYVDDEKNIKNGMLTIDQNYLLASFRTLEEYIDNTYSDLSYHLTGVLPAQKTSLPYDEFYISINGGREYTFRVQAEDDKFYSVIYDEFLTT